MAARQKSSKIIVWAKMLVAGATVAIGGPALTMWVRPTEEELFERYSPELKQKSLEQRHQREKEFDDFVTRLKEQSKSDKNIWIVQKEAAIKAKEDKVKDDAARAEAQKARQAALRKEAGLSE